MAHKKAAPLRVQTDYGEVALAPKSGKYWHLNSTAAQILDELQTGGDARSATDALVATYGISAEQASRDVASTIASLHREGLV